MVKVIKIYLYTSKKKRLVLGLFERCDSIKDIQRGIKSSKNHYDDKLQCFFHIRDCTRSLALALSLSLFVYLLTSGHLFYSIPFFYKIVRLTFLFCCIGRIINVIVMSFFWPVIQRHGTSQIKSIQIDRITQI